MCDEYSELLEFARISIRRERKKNDSLITSEMIRNQIVKAAVMAEMGALDGETLNSLARQMEEVFSTWIGRPQTLVDDENHQPWLPAKKSGISWRFWLPYLEFLKSKGWSEAAVTTIEETSEKILSNLEDPQRPGAWKVHGMVVGEVQSGKTANYIGLICRALDAGYKVIVVLAGMHNSLRSQTQIRIDEGVLGFDSIFHTASASGNRIGVGNFGTIPPVDTVTTREDSGDFSRKLAKNLHINPGGHPLLFVVKKFGSVLKNLIEWVSWAAGLRAIGNERRSIQGIPLLVIDDEADHGSVDTRMRARNQDGSIDEDHDPTVINRRIRELLYHFEKGAYVGYTATPFANIFIPHSLKSRKLGPDLFPKNFITVLPVPSNHMGPSKVFGIRAFPDSDIEEAVGLPVIRRANDASAWLPQGHKKGHVLQSALPASLTRALRTFLLSCAARRARGQTSVHNSMLIHVTRFVEVQRQVQEQVKNEWTSLLKRILLGDGDRTPSILDDLRELWEEDFIPTTNSMAAEYGCSPADWRNIAEMLPGAASVFGDSGNVRQINGTAKDVLDYIEHRNTGLGVVAIGGDKLSRGLTLEGLTVSYFLRNSSMYDTLMQMGRWFGYRPGYMDLCRLYISDKLKKDYLDITFADEELRREFNYMADSGDKPDSYGLKVRSHSSLLVTAPVKMRESTKIYISFAGEIKETVVFHRDGDTLNKNFAAAVDFASRLTDAGFGPHYKKADGDSLSGDSRCWIEVSPEYICQFLNDYRTHEDNRKVRGELLAQYIEEQVRARRGDLRHWTVLLASGQCKDVCKEFPGGDIKLLERGWHESFDPQKTEHPPSFYRIRRLVSPVDELVDISTPEWEQALSWTKLAWQHNPPKGAKNDEPPDRPAGWAARRVRPSSRGLLLIYPLRPDGEKAETGLNGPPIIGVAISFPGNQHDKKVTWRVNDVYRDREFVEDSV